MLQLINELKTINITVFVFLTLSARRSGACCSPDCDWLLDYLEIDSTVVKCLDRK